MRFDVDVRVHGNDDPHPERERLIVTWFVAPGETDRTRTSFLEDRFRSKRRRRTSEIPDGRDDDAQTARIWVVIRDGRHSGNIVDHA